MELEAIPQKVTAWPLVRPRAGGGDEPVKPRRSIRVFGLAKCPTVGNRIGKEAIRSSSFFDSPNEVVKVLLKQVFEQAGRNRCSEILVGMPAPPKDE
jgi:hypothetical protein